jgi:hypothetical protein
MRLAQRRPGHREAGIESGCLRIVVDGSLNARPLIAAVVVGPSAKEVVVRLGVVGWALGKLLTLRLGQDEPQGAGDLLGNVCTWKTPESTA